MNALLIYPMAFYVVYIFALLIKTFKVRQNAIKNKRLSIKYFRNYSDKSQLPESLLVHERHVDNQFQMPVLFLITCSTHLAMQTASHTTIGLAWLFVALRLIHSYIHLGSNNVTHRAIAYSLGMLTVLGLWLDLIFSV